MMKKNKYFDFYPPVFYPAVILIVIFIIVALTNGEVMESYLGRAHNYICNNFGWLIILSVNFFLVFAFYLAFSRFGNIRIGGQHTDPEFSFFAWFSMLFTAGLGSGMLFFGVVEPITHYINPPTDVESKAEMVRNAMQWTFLHFGFHGWVIYLLVGLAVAFATFNRGLPLTFSATFHPVLIAKIDGVWGNFIDIITVITNLFGVALALTIAAQLLSNGLNRLFGIPDILMTQIGTIAVITIGATISVVLGLKKGIKALSTANVWLALTLMVLMLFLGPTVYVLDSFVQNTGAYIQQLIALGTWSEVGSTKNWQNNWTIFYWIWWMAWAPFVGTFIARISKGKTVREFILFGLVAPTLLVFLWFSVFGGSALLLETQAAGTLADSVKENPASGFFEMLRHYPFSWLLSLAFLLLASIFFITSSDSASLVNDFLTSGGNIDAPKGQRIFWAATEGVVACILLSFGGMGVFNGVVTLFGFVFMIVLWGMSWSLFKGLEEADETFSGENLPSENP